MAGIKQPPKKRERVILASYRNIPLSNLRDVMQRESNNLYKAEYPIYDQDGDKLLLDRGKTVSEKRFRQLELTNWRHIKMHKEPRYYFQRKKPE